LSTRGIVDDLYLPVNLRQVDNVPTHDVEGSQILSHADYTLRATVNQRGDLPRLYLHVYRRTVERMGKDRPQLAAAGVT